jgi:antitoxin PrlF
MPTATLTSKGQLTVPQSVRAALGLHTGSKVDFVAGPDGFTIAPVRPPAVSLKGRFAGRVSRAVTIEAMHEAVVQAAADAASGTKPASLTKSRRPVRG